VNGIDRIPAVSVRPHRLSTLPIEKEQSHVSRLLRHAIAPRHGSAHNEALAIAGEKATQRPEGLVREWLESYAGLKPAPTAMARMASAPRE